jgi:hypothetical protein
MSVTAFVLHYLGIENGFVSGACTNNLIKNGTAYFSKILNHIARTTI